MTGALLGLFGRGMMSEATFRRYLIKGLKSAGADATAHEDMSPGVPDISFGHAGCNGWIECKTMDQWPARDSTKCRFKHPLTPAQRNFLRRRGKAGGHCAIALRVGREYLLFHWTLADLLHECTRKGLLELAVSHWHGSIDFDELLLRLCWRGI